MNQPDLPPITDAHRQQALELMSWRGWTLAAALADPIRSRVLECRAAAIRTREWQAAHARETRRVRRCDPVTGAWSTQRVAGDYTGQGVIDAD